MMECMDGDNSENIFEQRCPVNPSCRFYDLLNKLIINLKVMFSKVSIEYQVNNFSFFFGLSWFLVYRSRLLSFLFLFSAKFNLGYDRSIVASGEECHLLLPKRSQKGIPVRVKLIIMSQLSIGISIHVVSEFIEQVVSVKFTLKLRPATGGQIVEIVVYFL